MTDPLTNANGSNQPIPITWRGERPLEPVAGDAYFSPENVIRRDDGALVTLGMVLARTYDPAKRRPIVLVLPGGYHLVVDAAFWGTPNPDRNGWDVFGEPPEVGDRFMLAMRPSVSIPDTFHGFVDAGVIGANLETDVPAGLCPLCGHQLAGILVQLEGMPRAIHELCHVRAVLGQVQAQRNASTALTIAILTRCGGTVRVHRSDLAMAAQLAEKGGLALRPEPGGMLAVGVAQSPGRLVVAPAGSIPIGKA